MTAGKRIALTGSTGMVGTALSSALAAGGNLVIPVSRTSGPGIVHWDTVKGEIDGAGLEGLDAVVHLAGANLADGRWTEERKQELWHSRTDTTDLLSMTLAHLNRPPAVLVSVSAVGYYGDRGDELVDESSPPGSNFLARLCVAWEAAANPARAGAIRVVHPRFATILSNSGGALGRMRTPFNLGVGGPFGDGQQWFPWITLDDVLRGIVHVIDQTSIIGPVNFVAPQMVRNEEFAHTLGKVMHRPSRLHTPAVALRVAVGTEMADEALLSGQRVMGEVLNQTGFEFAWPDLEGALEHLLG